MVSIHPLDEEYLLVVVDLVEFDFDNFAAAGGDVAADVGCFDGQFAVASVDEHSELNAARTAVVEERVEGGANGTAGVEDIVAEDNITTFHVAAKSTGGDDGAHIGGGEVVTIELDIEGPGFDGALFDVGDQFAEALGERSPAALDADQGQVFAAVAFFDNFVGEAHQGALNLGGGHQPALDAQGGCSCGLGHMLSCRMIEGCSGRGQVVEDSFQLLASSGQLLLLTTTLDVLRGNHL